MTEQFVDLLNFEDYEVLNEYPFTIRKKVNQKIIKEWTNDKGYKCVDLISPDNKRHKYKKHRLIAEQFIPNPDNLPEIDHINKQRDGASIRIILKIGLHSKKLNIHSLMK